MADFNIDEWAREYELEESTIAALAEKGFKSRRSLSKLNTELIKKEFARAMVIAQQLLLSEAVEALQGPRMQSTSQAGASGAATSVPTMLQDVLSGNNGAEPNEAAHSSMPGITQDPQIFLKGGCNKVKFLDIVDFINVVPPMAEEHVMCDDKNTQVLFRTGSKRPALETIAIEEWCLANTRIMYALSQTADQVFDMHDYMSYTVKICDLFKHFEKSSVFQFDREYRHLQSVYGYRWGTDTPHLHTTCLKPKFRPSRFNYHGKSNLGNVKSADREICRLYNTFKGCYYGNNCKFTHKCSEPGCGQTHSRAHAHTAQTFTTARVNAQSTDASNT